MKQAILLLLHHNYLQASRLITFFQGECDIFIHVDKGGTITRNEIDLLKLLPGVVGVYSKYHIHWAGFSILKAEIFLLSKALKHSHAGYIHLLSGQDYPIKPLTEFLKFFSHTSILGYIGCQHMPYPAQDNNTFYRLQYFIPSDYITAKTPEGQKRVWKFVNWQRRHGIKRRIPDYFDHLYGGSAWFSISRVVAQHIMNYTQKHPAFYHRLRMTYIPEEIYFATVMLNSPYADKIIGYNNCRTILWNFEGIDCSPIDIQEDKFCNLLDNPIGFFSRKFILPKSIKVLNLIDKYLLSKPKIDRMSNGGWKVEYYLYAYRYDIWLCNAIADFCKEYDLLSVCDYGCGPGWYVANLRRKGIDAIGYDANPYTQTLSDIMAGKEKTAICCTADLSEDVDAGKTFDLIISLEVGAYIPKECEKSFIENLKRNAGRYIVITWNGNMHDLMANPRADDYIISQITHDGLFVYNEIASSLLRSRSRLSNNKRSVLVFQKV